MLRKKFLQVTGQLVLGVVIFESCIGVPSKVSPAEKSFIKSNQRIGFFGDSITFSGQFIKILEEKAKANSKYDQVTFANYGKSSETVSGLSEAIHDPVRPLLFDRLQSVFDQNKPDLLFFWYGINDAIYHPFSEERFNAYKNGVERFLSFAQSKGCKVVLLTPGLFGISAEAKTKLEQKENADYSWMNPYPDYNEVMRQYRDYILTVDHPSVVKKIDLYAPLNENKDQAYNEDPIHPNSEGHRIIAEEIYTALF